MCAGSEKLTHRWESMLAPTMEGSLLISVLDAGVSRCLGFGSEFRSASDLVSQFLCLSCWEEGLWREDILSQPTQGPTTFVEKTRKINSSHLWLLNLHEIHQEAMWMSLDKGSKNSPVVPVSFHMHVCSRMWNILDIAMSVSSFVLTSECPS